MRVSGVVRAAPADAPATLPMPRFYSPTLQPTRGSDCSGCPKQTPRNVEALAPSSCIFLDVDWLEDVAALATQMDARFFATSAKDGRNVEEAFRSLAEMMAAPS